MALEMQTQLYPRNLGNRDCDKLLSVMPCGVANERNDSQAEGVNGMARIIEFHVPEGFKPATKYVPAQERGTVIVFPTNLTRSAADALPLDRESTQRMNTELIELPVVIWPLQELAQSTASAFTRND
jgi:hypothetical protein